MENFILDTNLFFNMEAGFFLGKNTKEVIINLTDKAKRLKKLNKVRFIISPRIVDEFLSFFPDYKKEKEDKNYDFIKEFFAVVDIESPDINNFSFSANVFYKLIDDIRSRSYRGMNIAEEEIEKTAQEFLNKKIETKKDFQIKVGYFIKNFRERYRKATRSGFLDSLADLDLIVLAKQKDGFLVSTDDGVLSWAQIFGVKQMPSEAFLKRLEFFLLSHQE